MSVILEGIDLPTNGETLIVGIYSNGNVSIEYSKPLVLAIDPNVKAIQIPKGHGDIKDVGNIIKKFDENIALAETKPMVMYADAFLNDALEWSAEYNTIKDDIDNAPTILEAEK